MSAEGVPCSVQLKMVYSTMHVRNRNPNPNSHAAAKKQERLNRKAAAKAHHVQHELCAAQMHVQPRVHVQHVPRMHTYLDLGLGSRFRLCSDLGSQLGSACTLEGCLPIVCHEYLPITPVLCYPNSNAVASEPNVTLILILKLSDRLRRQRSTRPSRCRGQGRG